MKPYWPVPRQVYLVDLDKLEKNSCYIRPLCEKGELSRADHHASVQFFKIVFPFLLFELSNWYWWACQRRERLIELLSNFVGLHAFKSASLNCWITWFVSSWEENYKQSKYRKCQPNISLRTILSKKCWHFVNLLSLPQQFFSSQLEINHVIKQRIEAN